MLTPQQIETLMILDRKERMLSEIIVWLKSKNLWNECQKDLGFRILPRKEEEPKRIITP